VASPAAAGANRAIVRGYAAGAKTKAIPASQLGGAAQTKVLQQAPKTQKLPERQQEEDSLAEIGRLSRERKQAEAEDQAKNERERAEEEDAANKQQLARLLPALQKRKGSAGSAGRPELPALPNPGSIALPLTILLLLMFFVQTFTVTVTGNGIVPGLAPSTERATRATMLWNVLTGDWAIRTGASS